MQTRTLRVLTGGDDGESMLADGMGDPKPDSDIGRIVYAFRQWRGEPAARLVGRGAARRVGLPRHPRLLQGRDDRRRSSKHGFVLTPGRYVGAEEQEDDGEPFAEKYPRLLAELEECFGEGERLTARCVWRGGDRQWRSDMLMNGR